MEEMGFYGKNGILGIKKWRERDFYGLKKWWKSGFLGKKMEGTGFYGLKNGGNGILGRNHGRKRILGINPILFYGTGRIWDLGSGGKNEFGGNLKFRVPGVAASLAPPSG